jgi:hypothetical protein
MSGTKELRPVNHQTPDEIGANASFRTARRLRSHSEKTRPATTMAPPIVPMEMASVRSCCESLCDPSWPGTGVGMDEVGLARRSSDSAEGSCESDFP